MSDLLAVTVSPHIKTRLDTRATMAWVIASLVPAGAVGIWIFGARSAAVMAVSVAACVLSELVWCRCAGREQTAGDLSAALTGLLLAYNMPVSIPLWMPAAGGAFAIIVTKEMYGGIGQNIVNPALAGRAMMLICWPAAMTDWSVDGVSSPTPLAVMHMAMAGVSGATGAADAPLTMLDLFVGRCGGCIGETSAAALLFGAAILLVKGIISWRIPAIYIATVAAGSWLLGRPDGPVQEVLVGGLMLGALYMATDYTTSPITPKGQCVFALGCGALTILIREYGGYPEGVSFSILMMNLTVPIIDRAARPRYLGEVRRHG